MSTDGDQRAAEKARLTDAEHRDLRAAFKRDEWALEWNSLPTAVERILAARSGATPAVLAEHVRFISTTISGSYPAALDPEAHTWRRVMKVAEEVGEVTQALLGHLGENPRKGQTHTLDDLRLELLDVALAALGAVSHLGADDDDTVALLNSRAEFVHFRLSRAVAMGEPDA